MPQYGQQWFLFAMFQYRQRYQEGYNQLPPVSNKGKTGFNTDNGIRRATISAST